MQNIVSEKGSAQASKRDSAEQSAPEGQCPKIGSTKHTAQEGQCPKWAVQSTVPKKG